jgi:hypothetical protein
MCRTGSSRCSISRSDQIGGVTTRYQQFAGRGRVFRRRLRSVGRPRRRLRAFFDHDGEVTKLPGCVGLRPLRKW